MAYKKMSDMGIIRLYNLKISPIKRCIRDNLRIYKGNAKVYRIKNIVCQDDIYNLRNNVSDHFVELQLGENYSETFPASVMSFSYISRYIMSMLGKYNDTAISDYKE